MPGREIRVLKAEALGKPTSEFHTAIHRFLFHAPSGTMMIGDARYSYDQLRDELRSALVSRGAKLSMHDLYLKGGASKALGKITVEHPEEFVGPHTAELGRALSTGGFGKLEVFAKRGVSEWPLGGTASQIAQLPRDKVPPVLEVAKVAATQWYARQPKGQMMSKFVFHAPSGALMLGSVSETPRGMLSALKKKFGIKGKKSDLVISGAFNRANNQAWLGLEYSDEHSSQVAALAKLLKKEGIGGFTVHAVPPKQVESGAWSFTLKHQHEGRTKELGTIKEVAEGRIRSHQ